MGGVPDQYRDCVPGYWDGNRLESLVSRGVRIALASIAALFLIALVAFTFLAIWTVDADLSFRFAQTAGLATVFAILFGFAAAFPG